MRAIAPAKVNLTLEVLGRREDGFHEIRSVMQTVGIVEEVKAERAPELVRQIEESEAAHASHVKDLRSGEAAARMRLAPHRFNWSSGNRTAMREAEVFSETVVHALALLDPDWKRDAEVYLDKEIPESAGLGGGSSDGAAALRVLNALWELGLDRASLADIGAQIGSDVPFFCYGGTAAVSGRGEIVEPLPDVPEFWTVIVTPPLDLANKTRAMYAALKASDFTDGTRTAALERRIRGGECVRPDDLHNAFDRAALEMFDGLAAYEERLIAAGAAEVHLAGSGPALFALAADEAQANAIRGRLDAPDCSVHVARSLSAAEATAIYD
jgi:4-diphosphocytidyl-2-C-methyl-D-erythritol kinase